MGFDIECGGKAPAREDINAIFNASAGVGKLIRSPLQLRHDLFPNHHHHCHALRTTLHREPAYTLSSTTDSVQVLPVVRFTNSIPSQEAALPHHWHRPYLPVWVTVPHPSATGIPRRIYIFNPCAFSSDFMLAGSEKFDATSSVRGVTSEPC